MSLQLRRAITAAASSASLRRGLSTAASRTPWAMIYSPTIVRSPALCPWFHVAVPPHASHVVIPAHIADPWPPRPDPNPDGDITGLGAVARASSGNGLLLIDFVDGRASAPFARKRGTAGASQVTGIDMDPDVTRFVCDPLGELMFRLPDIDGTKKTLSCQSLGLLTAAESEGMDWQLDGYAVAELSEDHDGEERSFVMRRFLSQTGEWEKLAGLPSPLPLPRRMDIDHEVLAFAGRLWWVDVSWGAVSADPFSERPDLRFVELPRGSVTETVEGVRELSMYRRMGVSEGKLRYAEVLLEEPFVLSLFALEDDCRRWTLEYRVELSRLWANGGKSCRENLPTICTIDPLKAGIVYLTRGNFVVAVDMDKEKTINYSVMGENGSSSSFFSGLLKPYALPLCLGSSRIPSAAP
ncbi:hypothetical protein ACP70R_035526 [Stipagrostis hirtigluma subsp. patula]